MTRSSLARRLVVAGVLPAVLVLSAAADAPDPEALRKALTDLKSGDWVLQWAAMKQLVDSKHPQAPAALREVLAGKGNDWIRGRALVALAELQGKAALPEVARAATARSEQLRAAAADAMGVLGSSSTEALERLLKDTSAKVRLRAVIACARIKGRSAWPMVRPLLDSKDPAEVAAAVEAAVFIRTEQADGELMKLMSSPDPSIRITAARALGRARVAAAIPLLLKQTAGDRSKDVRQACGEALGHFEVAVLQGPLLKVLAAEDQSALYAAAMSVISRRPTPGAARRIADMLKSDPKRYASVLPDAIRLLAGVDADGYQPVFVEHLRDDSASVRLQAVRALARCAKGDLFTRLRPVLVDTHQHVRAAAYKAIRGGTTGAPPGGIVAYLADALASPDGRVQSPAIELLRERMTPAELRPAIEALDRAFAGSSSALRKMAHRVLEPMIDEPTARLVAARQGFVTEWRILGPYAGGLARVYEPELKHGRTKYPRRRFAHGAAFGAGSAASDGISKEDVLRIAPPNGEKGGRTVARYVLDMPQTKALALRMLAALSDGGKDGNGVQLEVWVDGKRLSAEKLEKPQGWLPRQVDLSVCAGRRISLRLVVDALGNGEHDLLALAAAEVVADEKVVHDLLALAPTAGLWTERKGAETISWRPARTSGTGGTLVLHDLLRAHYQAKVAYAAAEIRSPAEQKVRLDLSSRDGFQFWLNGRKIGQASSYGSRQIGATLKAGENRLLLKVGTVQGYWYAAVRVCDPKGKRLDSITVLPAAAER